MQYLSSTMLEVLKFFYTIGGHNYGLAIVWLTVAVNIALYPLTLTSIKQMSAMQRLQPRLNELQKKYKEEPKQLQKEMMDLYKGEGINPLGGCLPMLLKIPFFLALFWALQSKEFIALVTAAGAGNQFLWIADIAKPDPLRIMPVLIGITTWMMQQSMPATGQTQMMNWFMPIFIVIISVTFPAGVQLYWLVSNAVGAAQQYYIISKTPKKGKAREGKDEEHKDEGKVG